MLIGYARVSTAEQSLELQQDALVGAGCEKVVTEVASGGASVRPGLARALEYLRAGDTLVVWRLDRLGRSLKDLIETVTTLQAREIGFKSLQERIDTTSPGGKLVFHVFGALAEFERELIRERTQAGLKAARARGRTGGRPKAMDAAMIRMAKALLEDESTSVKAVCERLKVSRSTLYRALAASRDATEPPPPPEKRSRSNGAARRKPAS
jgi:DNA invertase Pin-like site-specific DNA recombinase